MNSADLPSTQIEAVRYFSDEAVCHEFLARMRWGNSVKCAHCESESIGKLVVSVSKTGKTRRLWNCKACKRQFTVKVGTIFEDSPLGLEKWLPAVWMICNAKNGVSSCEIARAVGVTQKSAWFMGHRIREAMLDGGFMVSGNVEADETYIGGKAANMHKDKKALRITGRGAVDKAPVLGVLQRSPKKGGSKVLLEALDNVKVPTIRKGVMSRVEKGSNLYTDSATAYTTMADEYAHAFVDHAIEYVKEKVVHTNGLENFWSLLKRTLKGTYVSVSREHLARYLDEQATRFNERSGDDQTRFLSTMNRVDGRRITYKALTGIAPQ